MNDVLAFPATVPRKVRWLYMFMHHANRQVDLKWFPSTVKVHPKFGRYEVDTGDLYAVADTLSQLKVRTRTLNGFDLKKVFNFKVSDASMYDVTSTAVVQQMSLVWGPLKFHPYAMWLALVSAYISKVVTFNYLNIALLDYYGEPGVLVTFADGSSALFLPGDVISPFRPDCDLEIYPLYPIVRRTHQFDPLPVITDMGRITGELSDRYRESIIYLIIASAQPDWSAYVHGWNLYWRTGDGADSPLYSLPGSVIPGEDGLPVVDSVIDPDRKSLYVVWWLNPHVEITPALAYDTLATMNLLKVWPKSGTVYRMLKREADRAVLMLRGMAL